VAIAYAKAQLGCPYVFGGTGPCGAGFDCSGLVMEAWARAGVTIPRTSQGQWASLRHVPGSQIRPGDLVFGPGGDGTWAHPGHVMMIISLHPAKVIEAYATGTPVMTTSLSDGSAAMGGTVGYARP
jgi:cell wall-associated NlpC family hydrolase